MEIFKVEYTNFNRKVQLFLIFFDFFYNMFI